MFRPSLPPNIPSTTRMPSVAPIGRGAVGPRFVAGQHRLQERRARARHALRHRHPSRSVAGSGADRRPTRRCQAGSGAGGRPAVEMSGSSMVRSSRDVHVRGEQDRSMSESCRSQTWHPGGERHEFGGGGGAHRQAGQLQEAVHQLRGRQDGDVRRPRPRSVISLLLMLPPASVITPVCSGALQ